MARCFLGFELTDDSREYLSAEAQLLFRHLKEERGWPVRLVPAWNWHATLLFFPELSAGERQAIWSDIQVDAAQGVWNTLGFRWRGWALWPSPRRPGLVCLEAEPCEAAGGWPLTSRLQQPPYTKGNTEHLRSYVPHLTLMRFRRGKGLGKGGGALPRRFDWGAIQEQLRPIDPERIRFDRISFFLSTVSPQAPIYPREATLSVGG